MFGFPALFLNGNMFASTYQDKIVVRLGADERRAALGAGASRFEPMPGRPMKEYVVVPSEAAGDPAQLRVWIGRALEYARTLPAKAPKR